MFIIYLQAKYRRETMRDQEYIDQLKSELDNFLKYAKVPEKIDGHYQWFFDRVKSMKLRGFDYLGELA